VENPADNLRFTPERADYQQEKLILFSSFFIPAPEKTKPKPKVGKTKISALLFNSQKCVAYNKNVFIFNEIRVFHTKWRPYYC